MQSSAIKLVDMKEYIELVWKTHSMSILSLSGKHTLICVCIFNLSGKPTICTEMDVMPVLVGAAPEVVAGGCSRG